MCWREQLKSETCLLKKVICFKYGRIFSKMRLNYNIRQRQLRASETEDKKQKIEKEKRNGLREKSAMTSKKNCRTKTKRSKIWLF